MSQSLFFMRRNAFFVVRVQVLAHLVQDNLPQLALVRKFCWLAGGKLAAAVKRRRRSVLDWNLVLFQ